MSGEEVLVERVSLSQPIGPAGEGEMRVSEEARHSNLAYEMSSRHGSSDDDDRPCDDHPERLESKGSVSGHMLLELVDVWFFVIDRFPHRQGVSGDERNPSEIVTAVDVLAPAQVRFEDPLRSFEDGFLQFLDLRRRHLAVASVNRVKHFVFKARKWIVFFEARFCEEPACDFS